MHTNNRPHLQKKKQNKKSTSILHTPVFNFWKLKTLKDFDRQEKAYEKLMFGRKNLMIQNPWGKKRGIPFFDLVLVLGEFLHPKCTVSVQIGF